MPEVLSTTPIREFSLHLENTLIRLFFDSPQLVSGAAVPVLPDPHIHVTAELFVCAEGEVILKTQEGFLNLHAGDAAIVPPGIFHTKYRIASHTTGYALCFLCTPIPSSSCVDLYKTLSPFMNENHILIYRQHPSLVSEVEKIVHAAEGSEEFLTILQLASLLIRLSKLSVTEAEATNDTPTSAAPVVGNDIQRIMHLEELIEGSYFQSWSLQTIADHLHLSVRQLDRICQKRFGKTLHAVMMDRRIHAAEKLLVTSDMTIEQIALTVGFHSVSGFYREFSRRHPISPSEFRQKER